MPLGNAEYFQRKSPCWAHYAACGRVPRRSVPSWTILAHSLTAVLGYRFRDGIIEAEIERFELGGQNGRFQLDGKLRNGRAKAARTVGHPPAHARASQAKGLARGFYQGSQESAQQFANGSTPRAV